MALSLTQRKNIRDAMKKSEETLEKIKVRRVLHDFFDTISDLCLPR
jgi:predicted transcriptional regulator